MKKVFFFLTGTAFVLFLSFCSKPNLSSELNPAESIAAVEPDASADRGLDMPVPRGCNVLVRVNMPCATNPEVFWSVSVSRASSQDAPCDEEVAPIALEFGRRVKVPGVVVTEQTIFVPENGACFHVFGTFPPDCGPVTLTYFDANGPHTINVPNNTLEGECVNFCATCQAY